MSACINFVFAVAAVDVVVVCLFFFFFFFLLACFVLIYFLVHYISNLPLYTCNIVPYISPTLYKHSTVIYILYVKLSVISSFHLKVGGGQLESFRYFDSL